MTTAAELAKDLRNRCSLMRRGKSCRDDVCQTNSEAADLLDRVAKLEAVAEAAKQAVSQMDQARHMLQHAASELLDQDYEDCANDEDREWLLLRNALRALEEK